MHPWGHPCASAGVVPVALTSAPTEGLLPVTSLTSSRCTVWTHSLKLPSWRTHCFLKNSLNIPSNTAIKFNLLWFKDVLRDFAWLDLSRHQGRCVVQLLSHLTLCDPKNCSMPGSSVFHGLTKFAQTHVH